MPVLKILNKDGKWEYISGISEHAHSKNDITDFPTSLPADGGNADTLDGKHASEFATKDYVDNSISTIPTPDVSGQIEAHNISESSHSDIRTTISNISDLVGDTAVSEQITNAIANIPPSGIIDVVELPTEDIKEDVFYRVPTGKVVTNKYVATNVIIHCVNTLPEIGEPAASGDLSNLNNATMTGYYNITDNACMGYVSDELSGSFNVPTGWYPTETLMSVVGMSWNGVITNIDDDPCDDTFRLLLEYVIYSYKNTWISHKRIGAEGTAAHAETFNGFTNIASGNYSHAEGSDTIASGLASHAEGDDTIASGDYSHAEGGRTTASSNYSHAEGSDTIASGLASHAEGGYTTASGAFSHAEGHDTTASGHSSHVEGIFTIASSNYQHVQGKYNIEDTENKYAHIVGNGTFDTALSNAHTIDWDGLGWFAGGLKVGGAGQDDTTAKEVATKDYVDNSIANIPDGIYVHDEEPVDAEDGTLWLDTDEEAAVSGGANIDVTAAVGQTIVVEEVDVNGKPTKWKAADYQPRTHWSEEGLVQVSLFSKAKTSLNDTCGAFTFPITLNDYANILTTVAAVEYDGVEYTNLPSFSTNGMYCFGNLFFLNPVFGTAFENTGEPFILGSTTEGTMVLTTDSESTWHTIKIYINGSYHHRIDRCYQPQLPVVDLTKYYTSLDGKKTVTISGGDYYEEVYRVLKANDMVKVVYVTNDSGNIAVAVGCPVRSSIIGNVCLQIYSGVGLGNGIEIWATPDECSITLKS